MVGSTVRGLMILLFWLVSSKVGGIAQLGEHLLCKQGVIGSIPIGSTKPHALRCTAMGAAETDSRDEDTNLPSAERSAGGNAGFARIFDIVNGFFNRCRGASCAPDAGDAQ